MDTTQKPILHPVFEPNTGNWQYIIADPATHAAVIIDSVLDYDQSARTISTTTADALLALAASKDYTIIAILETHAHADHLTAAKYIQNTLAAQGKPRPPIGIGRRIDQVQRTFGEKYRIDPKEYTGVFDKLWEDDEEFSIGELKAKVLHLPGHTPDHVGYLIGENVFAGDSIFNPDVGSARCDFPGGDAHTLYGTVHKLFALPEHYRVYVGHDYPSQGGRDEPRPSVTVGEQKRNNKHVKEGVEEEDFVQWRMGRDSGLNEPRLIREALQFNIRAGQLPGVEVRYTERFGPVIVPEEAWHRA